MDITKMSCLFYFRVDLPLEYPFACPQFSIKKHDKFPYLFDGKLSLADFFSAECCWRPDHSPVVSIRTHVEALYSRLAFWGRNHLYLKWPRFHIGAAPANPDRGPQSFQLQINVMRFRLHSSSNTLIDTNSFEIPVLFSDSMMDIMSYIWHFQSPDDIHMFYLTQENYFHPRAPRLEASVTLNELRLAYNGTRRQLNLVGGGF